MSNQSRDTASKLDFWRLLSLRSDQAPYEVIDETIRSNSQLAGTNLWVLIFAIVIASVGLNVNSTAVIIGAMLISPLMGPIIGIGYGACIHDYDLIRKCLRTLAIFVSISLCASSAYFLISPLTTAHSELVARTSPNFWDVLVAFFGGAAGMVGLTRKEKTTLIPGVAIATALMPPICTAGYGLATGQIHFFLGAAFLFVINAVFISLATLVIGRILRLPERAFPDDAMRHRGRLLIGAAILLTFFPSSYLAYGLVRQEIFSVRAERFVNESLRPQENIALIRREIDPKERRITLTLYGNGVTPALEEFLNAKRSSAGIPDAHLTILHPTEDGINIQNLREIVRRDALQSAISASEQNTLRIAVLEKRLNHFQDSFDELARVEKEIQAQMPNLRHVSVTASPLRTESAGTKLRIFVAIDPEKKIASADEEKLRHWLTVRLPSASEIQLVIGKFDG